MRQIGEYMTRRLHTHSLTHTTWMFLYGFLRSLYRAIPGDCGAAIRVNPPALIHKHPSIILWNFRSRDCRQREILSRRFQVDTHKNKEHLQIPIVEPVRANAGAAALLLCVFAGVSLWCGLAHKSIAGEPERAPGAWCVHPCFKRTWYEIDRCTFGPARFQQIRPNFFFPFHPRNYTVTLLPLLPQTQPLSTILHRLYRPPKT